MSDETLDAWLSEQIQFADNSRRESRGIAPNSYGAGYDQGYYDALSLAFEKLRELWGYSLPPSHAAGDK